MNKRKTFLYVFTFFAVFVGFVLLAEPANACGYPELASRCNYSLFPGAIAPYKYKDKSYYNVSLNYTTTDITKTLAMINLGTSDNLLNWGANTNTNELGVCSISSAVKYCEYYHIPYSVCNAMSAVHSYMLPDGRRIDENTVACACLDEQSFSCGKFNNQALASENGGSLAYMTMLATDQIKKEAVPVNLALYGQDLASRTPFIKNTALAATTYAAIPGDQFILSLWKLTRNIAYGIISIIMVVIGIMIVTRYKFAPQSVVTVQQALPRVVISLVLITFSYPIGAVLVSLIIPLLQLTLLLVGLQATQAQPVDILALLSNIGRMVYSFGGAGFALLSGVSLFVVSLLLAFIAALRVILIYIQLSLSIIVAPIKFAFAAIPGKEDQITMWFKDFLSKILAAPAMVVMILLSWYVWWASVTTNIFAPKGLQDIADILHTPAQLPPDVNDAMKTIIMSNLAMYYVPIFALYLCLASMRMPGLMKQLLGAEEQKKRR